MCFSLENPDLVLQETGISQALTHSRPAECGSRQSIQVRPDHPNGMVTPSRGLPVNMHQVAQTSNDCNQVQQVTSVCVTSSRSPGMGSGCTQPALGQPYAFPSVAILGKWWQRTTHAVKSYWFFQGGPICPGSVSFSRIGSYCQVLLMAIDQP